MRFDTGGGATMDVGCYPISWLRHLMRREPDVVAAVARTGPPDVDLRLEVQLEFDGIPATAVGSMAETEFDARLTLRGSRGELLIVNPVAPQLGSRLELRVGDALTTETPTRRPTYEFQLEAFVNAVRTGAATATNAEDAVKQMRVIDAAYRAAGLPTR